MIGPLIARIATILPMVLTIRELHSLATREITPNQIYSTREAARYLGLDRRATIKLLRENKLKGKLVNGNYRILGKSLLEYLGR